MAASSRRVAAQALARCERGGYSQLVIDSAIGRAGLSPRDAAFASALFYGALERKLTLDHCLKKYARHPLTDEVAAVLRVAVYQLLYMDSVPPHAAVSEAVDSVRALRQSAAGGMVNGILRAFLRDGRAVPPTEGDLQRLMIAYSCGETVTRRLLDWYGPERTESILAASLGRPPLFLRVNTLRTDADSLAAALAAEGIETAPGPLPDCLTAAGGDVARAASHQTGLFHIQDASSQRAALAVGAAPGERILDVCAAPGSKSFVMAQRMGDRGEIVCRDLSEKRLRLVERGAKRLGISILSTRPSDGAVRDPALGVFDRVLCDVPCSGLGVLRRKPEIKYRGGGAFDGLPELQYKILDTSSHYCKAGGRLVYSTCTVNPEENERVVARFLAGRPEFSPEDGGLSPIPPGDAGGDGFFIARLRRST